MKAEQELEKDALAAEQVPTVYTELNAIVIEAEQPCRMQSELPFLAPKGIFTSVDKRVSQIIIRGVLIEVIEFNLTVNTAKVRISPTNSPANCSKDGVTFVPAQSVNVRAVAEPIYTKKDKNVTNVRLFFTRTNKNKPATLGIRAKFEEGVTSPTQFNPKRKTGQVSFP